MCGRFANHLQDMHRWAALLADWPAGAPTGFNVAPTQQVPVLTSGGVYSMRWGLIPRWSKDAVPRFATFNARIETVAEKPAFREPWRHRQHCLIPILGYYEWKTEGRTKQPYFIRAQVTSEPLVLAGLWEQRDEALSFTVLTEPAVNALTELHRRMPVMLQPEHAMEWLLTGESLPSDGNDRSTVQYYAVDKGVNNTRHQGETLISPALIEPD
ncbi:SOS response-associated peptidase [Teredinibacter purpureus]|jgi:Uncharacterized conserved protein|uniref:SOS response-associated peptidase n=1 Tax=Teredinibacter purpureus TaxID=2731756 RepID=UPI0005F817CA|nr:SOS response-associated peptidase [Teredinibacter purpureus]